MKPHIENASNERLSDEEFFNLKDDLQYNLILDAGIQPDHDSKIIDWINTYSKRFDKIFNQEIALNYRADKQQALSAVKNKLYH